jgi:hypothetical protein
MKTTLVPRYRARTFPLLPMGLQLAARWRRDLDCQVRIDADTLTLGDNCKVPWKSISRIGVLRSCLDGHASEVRIHHHGGVSKILVRTLRNGDKVVTDILTMFELTHHARQRCGTDGGKRQLCRRRLFAEEWNV